MLAPNRARNEASDDLVAALSAAGILLNRLGHPSMHGFLQKDCNSSEPQVPFIALPFVRHGGIVVHAVHCTIGPLGGACVPLPILAFVQSPPLLNACTPAAAAPAAVRTAPLLCVVHAVPPVQGPASPARAYTLLSAGLWY